jgi:hypothetical protein
MDEKKVNELYSMLEQIITRLDRIESVLTEKTIKNNIGYLDDSSDEGDYGISRDNSYIKLDQNALDQSDDSDDESPIVMEESYDSDHDKPFEAPEVYPEPKLLLTPLQIQLANEEFMQYKGNASDEK